MHWVDQRAEAAFESRMGVDSAEAKLAVQVWQSNSARRLQSVPPDRLK